MNKETLQEQIAKLQKAIASPATDEKLKVGMRAKLSDLEAKLSQLEQEEAAEKDDAKADKPAADKPAKEKAPKPAPKPKATKENKDKAVPHCKEIILAVHKVLSQYESGKAAPRRKEKAKKKRASEIVSSGIVGTVTRVVKMELTKDKVVKINTDELADAKKHFTAALKHLRSGLGGIKSDSTGFIEDFEKEWDGLTKLVKEKQEAAKKAAA